MTSESSSHRYRISEGKIILDGHACPTSIDSEGILSLSLNGVNIYLRKLQKSFDLDNAQLTHNLLARSWSFDSKESKTTLKFLNKKTDLYGYSKYKQCVVYKDFYSEDYWREEEMLFGHNINNNNNIYNSIWKLHLCRNELFLFRNEITRFRVYIHHVVRFSPSEVLSYHYNMSKAEEILYF
ncbi:hypothetical protein GKZ68_20640 (plasmid) [Hymenobacter sp. BRD128]|uniref:hypothetical protein n=1 Tax=Hymenobacter sp. BRD128 TaxID=2675878 RepID=UPI0015674259|nr:hypothetical protein [Hymenobacter sp. BRD128]QKG59092.1 hypothetical protein GKZ68_20640 [Hymenobacter sp. BRD128]